MGDMKNAHRILVGILKEGSHSEDKGIHGRVMLEWILRK